MNEKLQKAIDKWEEISDKHSDVGAADSEPRDRLYWLLEKKLTKCENRLPLTARQWELYDGFETTEAVNDLNKAAKKVLNVIDKMTWQEVEATREYLGYE
jgi:hypothetical protein